MMSSLKWKALLFNFYSWNSLLFELQQPQSDVRQFPRSYFYTLRWLSSSKHILVGTTPTVKSASALMMGLNSWLPCYRNVSVLSIHRVTRTRSEENTRCFVWHNKQESAFSTWRSCSNTLEGENIPSQCKHVHYTAWSVHAWRYATECHREASCIRSTGEAPAKAAGRAMPVHSKQFFFPDIRRAWWILTHRRNRLDQSSLSPAPWRRRWWWRCRWRRSRQSQTLPCFNQMTLEGKKNALYHCPPRPSR